MRKFDDYREKQLRDEEFRKEYENMQSEFKGISSIVKKRKQLLLKRKK